MNWKNSQRTGEFEVEKYVGIYPAKKHDHFLNSGWYGALFGKE